jgi:hypothetical protein
MVLDLRLRMEHIRYGRNLPRLLTSVDFNAMLLVRPLVTAFRLVCAVTQDKMLLARLRAQTAFVINDQLPSCICLRTDEADPFGALLLTSLMMLI